jgi:hypothetical protein
MFQLWNIPHAITYAIQSHSAPHSYQRSTTNQIQLLFADQSALTAAATSLGYAHQDLYKRQLLDSNHQIISELQSVTSDIQ